MFENIDKLPKGPWILSAGAIRPVEVNNINELAYQLNKLLELVKSSPFSEVTITRAED